MSTSVISDIVEFIRCELLMRALKTSATDLAKCRAVSEASLAGFNRVRKAMTKADRPASRRPPPNPQVRAAWLPSFTFDPITHQAIMVCNTHWILIHFLLGVTWLDCDDDKLGHSAQLFKEHGMRMTPTKDKKLKPVIHVFANVGSGDMCCIFPDRIKMKLGEMMQTAINMLFPST